MRHRKISALTAQMSPVMLEVIVRLGAQKDLGVMLMLRDGLWQLFCQLLLLLRLVVAVKNTFIYFLKNKLFLKKYLQNRNRASGAMDLGRSIVKRTSLQSPALPSELSRVWEYSLQTGLEQILYIVV